MLDFRLKSLDIFNHMEYPDWGPDISELDMDNIVTYVRPNAQMKADWNDVPDDIKDTFDRLGIPEAEKTSLAGVGAQYDSEVVYHSIQDELVQQGVVYTDFDTALEKYEDIVKAHFMKLVPPTDHKFARPARCCLVRWLLRLRPGRCRRLHPAAELFPPQCAGRRPV
mgnify:CR=1 FL=1